MPLALACRSIDRQLFERNDRPRFDLAAFDLEPRQSHAGIRGVEARRPTRIADATGSVRWSVDPSKPSGQITDPLNR